MVALNFDRARPESLLNLNEVAELRGWSRENGTLRLGAGLTYAEAMSGALAEALPALAEASRTVGSPQIRNRGTIGGNLGTASPAGDALPPLLVERARVELASARGVRELPLARVPARRQAQRARRGRADRRRARRAERPAADVHEGRPAECDGHRRLLARARRGSRAWRAARGLRVGGARRAPRRRSARRRGRRSRSRWPRQRARSTTYAELPRTADMLSASSRSARSTGASREDRDDRQRRAARGGRLGRREPPHDAPRPARSSRLEERVRAGRVRLVLGAPRRRARLRVPRSGRTGGRPRRRHRGRDRRGGRPAPGAGGVRGRGRCSVRLLHAGASWSPRRICSVACPPRPTTRSARRFPETSAAAPAIRRSSMRFNWRPSGERRHQDAAPRARCDEHASHRRRPQGHGRVRVLERPARGRDALGAHGAEPARARARPRDRRDAWRAPCPASTPS